MPYFDGFLGHLLPHIGPRVTLWSHDPPDLGENAENAQKMRKMCISPKKAKNAENAQKCGKMRIASPPCSIHEESVARRMIDMEVVRGMGIKEIKSPN